MIEMLESKTHKVLPDYGSVLLIDDSLFTHDSIRYLFPAEQVEIISAMNGVDGIELARKTKPDLIILDIMMPGKSGFDVCVELRKDAALEDIPIILLSALTNRESLLKGLELGADDYVEKPFDRLELKARIRTILKLKRYRKIVEHRRHFKWLLDEADEGYMIFNSSRELIYINNKAQEMTDVHPDLESGSDPDFLELLSNRFKFSTDFSKSYIFQSPLDTDCFWQASGSDSGTALWYRGSPRKIEFTGSNCTLIQIRDVSKKLEDERIAHGILALASHKLRTPMNHICGGLELMSTVDESTPYSEWQEYIEYITQGVSRLQRDLTSIFRFMELGKVVSQQVFREKTKKDLILKILNETAAQVDVKLFGCEIPNDFSTVLDSETIRLVVGELFTNAKKFHPDKKPNVEVAIEWHNEGEVTFEYWVIKDDGISLSPKQRENATSPFTQNEKQFTGEVPGLGVGLNVIAKQLSLYSGALWLKNRKDINGVEVHFKVPA
jgi:DNA-binding response OmpR family regulator/anti-sigma regulatory factor (Ser/Thr protein kinase)